MSAAAFENNYDPLIALKTVLAGAPPHRRAEARKRRLDAFEESDVKTLLEEHHKCAQASSRPQLRQRQETSSKEESKPHAAAMRMVEFGMPGKALRKLTDVGTVHATEEAMNQLKQLHPEAPDPPPCTLLTNPPQLSARHVSSALRSMRQSAPGPSGLRADHLLLAFPKGSGDSLLAVLRKIVEGSAPKWLPDARLLALSIKAEGLRPIAVGETLGRLASAAFIRTCKDQLPTLAR